MKIKYIVSAFAALAVLCSCHKPEFVKSTADRQGITSISAIITSGKYENQVLAKLVIDEASYLSGVFVIEVPYYFPETSTDPSNKYLGALRLQAELQPNFRIEPALGKLDMTEMHDFTLYSPDGTSRPITIAAKRVKSSACQLLSFLVEDYMVSGVIYEDQAKILIPYMGDLSSVTVSGQVSPNARISEISGAPYDPQSKYDMGDGATVTVLASNGTSSKTYTVNQGIPELVDMGMNVKSVKNLFNIDPVTMCSLPPYTEKTYVSLAGLGNNVIVCTGDGTAPVYLDAFTGKNLGRIALGSAVADAVTNDDKGNMLIVNYAAGGETVNIYTTTSVAEEPSLLCSFSNPSTFPVGHRIKAIGDVKGEAVIVLTTEGILGVSVSSQAVAVHIASGAKDGAEVVDFAGKITAGGAAIEGWADAPLKFATVVPASLEPGQDGWFLDFYEGNAEAVDGSDEPLYILHHITSAGADEHIGHFGDWGNNPNCLDIKTFNHARYMALFVVSHFPHWGRGPQLHLYDVTDPAAPSLILSNDAVEWFQSASYSEENGASGDVVICPSTDGYRTYIYYYDHHSQAIGAYVADCFKI